MCEGGFYQSARYSARKAVSSALLDKFQNKFSFLNTACGGPQLARIDSWLVLCVLCGAHLPCAPAPGVDMAVLGEQHAVLFAAGHLCLTQGGVSTS